MLHVDLTLVAFVSSVRVLVTNTNIKGAIDIANTKVQYEFRQHSHPVTGLRYVIPFTKDGYLCVYTVYLMWMADDEDSHLCRYSRDGQRLFSAARDGHIIVFDVLHDYQVMTMLMDTVSMYVSSRSRSTFSLTGLG